MTKNGEVEIEKVEAYCNKKGWTLLEYCEWRMLFL